MSTREEAFSGWATMGGGIDLLAVDAAPFERKQA